MPYVAFTIIFLIFQLFLNQSTFAQGDSLQLQEFACNAADPNALRKCISEIQTSGVPLISITQPFNCKSKSECEFNISNIKTGVTIRGLNPDIKLLRQGDYSYSIFNVENSKGFRFEDIYIEDDGSVPCLAGVVCTSIFTVKNSENIAFENINFKNTHGTSLSITGSKNIKVTDSDFIASFKNGLEVNGESVIIQDNNFEGNAGSALIFQAQATGANKSQIAANKFINNHSKGAYSSCTYPCTGSQIKITGPTSNLNITRNTIAGGIETIFDLAGLFSSGIEIGSQDLQNITLSCNEIASNRGAGIVQSPPFRNLGSIILSENKIWGNGINLNIPIARVDNNNCYHKDCRLSCMDN